MAELIIGGHALTQPISTHTASPPGKLRIQSGNSNTAIMAEHANVSSDLIWEVCSESAAINESTNSRDAEYAGPNNAFLVKRKSAGGSQFSRDPLNLMNKHSRKVS